MDTKKKLGILAVIVIISIAIGILTIRPWMQNRTIPAVVIEKIERPELNISFTFPSGEDAYSYIEPTLSATSTDGKPIAAFIMIENDAYIAFQDPSFVGETPPSMSIFVYKKPEVDATIVTGTNTPDVSRFEQLQNWAEANSALTAYTQRKGTSEEVNLDGATALHYQADGLYQQDTYVVFYKGKYYTIVGQYNATTDAIYADFQNLVHSISFL
jgi:hypothetical protein